MQGMLQCLYAQFTIIDGEAGSWSSWAGQQIWCLLGGTLLNSHGDGHRIEHLEQGIKLINRNSSCIILWASHGVRQGVIADQDEDTA